MPQRVGLDAFQKFHARPLGARVRKKSADPFGSALCDHRRQGGLSDDQSGLRECCERDWREQDDGGGESGEFGHFDFPFAKTRCGGV
jgi:hypothetical protein